MPKPFDPRRVCDDLISYAESACGDMAGGVCDYPDLDDEWGGRVKEARRRGIRDVRGYIADEFYEDVDAMADLCGDHLCDLAGGDVAKRNAVLDILAKRGNKWAQVAAKLRR